MSDIKMKSSCVEIVGVRLVHPEQHHSVKRMFREVGSGLQQNPGEFVAVSLYSSPGVETDWAIHLYRSSEARSPGKTGIGIHLAEALSSFGLVHHSVWSCNYSVHINFLGEENEKTTI